MNIRNITNVILLSCLGLGLQAQTMKWIPFEKGLAKGNCANESGKNEQLVCYALEYTPQSSGVLTSYTTGFLVSCTSLGSPISKNLSCSMSNSINLINGCAEFGKALVNSSGNSGTLTNNQIQAGIPVILHKVCFLIPKGESITISEDPITDLTTSIDVGAGIFRTEYPAFAETQIQNIGHATAPTDSWLDFIGTPIAEQVTQLTWSVTGTSLPDHFVIERSIEGSTFLPIGQVASNDNALDLSGYQFIDKNALPGDNFYRLQQINADGSTIYSAVRLINFKDKPLTLTCSPNPANDVLWISVSNQKTEAELRLVDYTGKTVQIEKVEPFSSQIRLTVDHLNPGVYNLIVESDQGKTNEKVVIIH